MKKLQKSTAIILSFIFGLLLVIGFIFSFVPMTFGAKTYVSLAGSLNISSDITGGLYGEYDIVSKNPSKSDIVQSMGIIQDIFEEDGYKNINVYAIGTSKIRVEASFPKGDKTYSSVYTKLSSVATGAFSLTSSQEITDDTIVLEGSKYVDEVVVSTYNSTKNMSIKFTKKGQEIYKQLCQKSSTIYLVLGDYNQSLSVEGATDFTALSLSNTDYDNLIALEEKIKLGCMRVELNSDTVRINTMSASLSAGESASSPEGHRFVESTAYIIGFIAVLVVVVLGLAVFAVKFGLYTILILATLLFNVYIFLGIMCIVPSIEFGLSTIASVIMGIAMIYTYAYAFASKVKSEYNLGKSINASLESAFKKQLPTLLMSNIMLFLASLVMFIFSFGELTSVAIVFTTCSFLSLFTNLLLIPLFIKIGITFNNNGRKVFMLKKRSGILDNSEEVLVKEAE